MTKQKNLVFQWSRTVLVAGLTVAPVAAATDASAGEAEPVLTYDEAVELALKNSSELKNAREGVLQAEEMREQLANLRRISGFTPVGPGYDQADAADRELLLNFTAADTAWRMAAKQVEILEETIAFQVRSTYDEVLQNTAGLETADRALAFAAKKLIQTETKTRLGMESCFNRENARSSYAAEKEQRERLARQLDEAYVSLNKLLGLEPEARPKLQEPGLPAWLEETGLESHLAPILHDHPYIWLQEQNVAQAERELSLYTYNIGAHPYKVWASKVQQEKNNLYALKEKVRKGVRSFYYQLQGLESQYKALEANLAQAENALHAVQLRFKLGMAVPVDIEQAELAVLEIKNGMQDLARAYGQLKTLFEKPWLMPAP
jgi:outer membrane protein TolC